LKDAGDKAVQIEKVGFAEVAERLGKYPAFASSDLKDLRGVDMVELVRARAGATVAEPGHRPLMYMVVLRGKLRAERPEQDGSTAIAGYAQEGEGFGETPILHGKARSSFRIVAEEESELVGFTEPQFWNLMAFCPSVRTVVIRDMTERLQTYQVEALHREKLVTLGTMSAGLMHELHNPVSAARRAAAQLRENLRKLQELALRMSEKPKTREQLECVKGLLEHAVRSCHIQAMSSVEEADAEERMGEWLSAAQVENAYTIGPALVEMGFDVNQLQCAKAYFEPAAFSDALNWLGALVSSMGQVCGIEESIGRVSELVQAVKKFAYDERSGPRELNVHDSLQSTLTILGHKLRIKQIKVEKRFNASPAIIETRGSALSQVWTNLIDNAADASPANGRIEIATWNEPEWLVVCIGDHGAGIADEVRPRIFEPFFTTKAQGSGTGLGLEIVHRIVTQKFGGRIDVESKPGDTRFVVRLPVTGSDQKSQAGDQGTLQAK